MCISMWVFLKDSVLTSGCHFIKVVFKQRLRENMNWFRPWSSMFRQKSQKGFQDENFKVKNVKDFKIQASFATLL